MSADLAAILQVIARLEADLAELKRAITPAEEADDQELRALARSRAAQMRAKRVQR